MSENEVSADDGYGNAVFLIYIKKKKNGNKKQHCVNNIRYLDYDERIAIRRSVRVKPKKCILHFKPGRTYTREIKLLNTTARPQIIRVQPPQRENKIFKFPDLTTVSDVRDY